MPDIPFDGGGPLGPSSGAITMAGTAMIGQPQRAPQIVRQNAGNVNMGRVGSRIVLSTVDLDIANATLQNIDSSAFPSVTFQHQVSQDGFRFTQLTGTTDMTAEGKSPNITVQGWAFYALAVSVAAPSDLWARVTLAGKSNT